MHSHTSAWPAGDGFTCSTPVDETKPLAMGDWLSDKDITAWLTEKLYHNESRKDSSMKHCTSSMRIAPVRVLNTIPENEWEEEVTC